MLSEFQKRKLTVLFHHQDMDHDGFVDQADYEQYAKRYGEIQDYPPGSPQYEAVYAQNMAIWEQVRQVADKDQDNRLSLDEFLASYDVTLKDEKLSEQFLMQYFEALLGLWDRDGDRRLSGVEYTAFLGCYGVGEEAAREAFRHLDQDGSGYLSTQELMQNARDFYWSDDPQAPGNWMVGLY